MPVLVGFGFLVCLGSRRIGGKHSGSPAASAPLYHEITFRRGEIRSARFAPDGQTILYSASWQGNPVETFAGAARDGRSRRWDWDGRSFSRFFDGGDGALVGQPSGRNLDQRGHAGASAFGGRRTASVLEDVEWADWSPDGNSLAVVRNVGGHDRLEFPIGKVLYETSGGWISYPRVSPKGDFVAFMDHPNQGDDGGSVAVVDLAGKSKRLTRDWYGTQGLAWSPDGKEIWFTASELGLDHYSRGEPAGKNGWSRGFRGRW